MFISCLTGRLADLSLLYPSVHFSPPVSLLSQCPDNLPSAVCMPLSRKAELLSVCRLLNSRSSCSVGNAFDMFSYSADLEPLNPARVEGGNWERGRGETSSRSGASPRCPCANTVSWLSVWATAEDLRLSGANRERPLVSRQPSVSGEGKPGPGHRKGGMWWRREEADTRGVGLAGVGAGEEKGDGLLVCLISLS